MQEDMINSSQNIGEEAVNVFKEGPEPANYDMINCIPVLINKEDNAEMERMPVEEEVKKVIFLLNADNASGPDGFSRQFFQASWEIIGKDITNMVRAFFYGFELPRYVKHTNLVIPPKEVVNNFGDLRPIGLSTLVII